MKFTELQLDEKLLKGIEDAGFTKMTPVQEESLKHSLKGKDVAVQSQTGTGKTAAFLITIFQDIQNRTNGNRQALIITPTRELAVQIEKEAKLLGSHLKLRIGCFYGGLGYRRQESLLEQGVDLIIGTPGRLLDFLSKDKLDFRNLQFLVIDEADRMLDMGFMPDIKRIVRSASATEDRQTMLFSATLDSKTREFSRNFMQRPVTIKINPEEVAVKKISQIIYHVSSDEKINLLLGVLKHHNPPNTLIFTNMKRDAFEVAGHLEANGYPCEHLSGDLAQKKRLRIIEKFKSGEIPILVATDVAARGLHVDDLELIINYDLPQNCENYVHRIGRTARAGKTGKSITLACENDIYNLPAIEDFLKEKIPVGLPDEELFMSSKSEGRNFRREQGSGARSSSNRRSSKKRDNSRKKKKPQNFKNSTNDRPEMGKKKNVKNKNKKQTKLSAGSSMEERLAYYKKKYGDDFSISP